MLVTFHSFCNISIELKIATILTILMHIAEKSLHETFNFKLFDGAV